MNCAVIVAILNCFIVFTLSSKVTTFLNAKWYLTPVCLEIAEYLFDESPSLYWDYVEQLNSLKTPLYEIGKFFIRTLKCGVSKLFMNV